MTDMIIIAGARLLPLLVAIFLVRLCTSAIRPGFLRRTNAMHELGVTALWFYLVAVMYVTMNIRRIIAMDFSPGQKYNIVPFAMITEILAEGSRELFSLNIGGNIAMFVPLGMFLPLLWARTKAPATLLTAALMSAAIETVQFFTGRVADVDDLILNMAGAALGYVIYLLLTFAIPPIKRVFAIREKRGTRPVRYPKVNGEAGEVI